MKILLLLSLTMMILAGPVMGQTDRIPEERVNPDAMVTLDADLDFREALSILSEFSEDHDGRQILMREEIDRPIGIDIPLMYWRRALDYVAGYNELEIMSYPDHLELVPRDADPDADPEDPEDDRTPTIGDRIIDRDTREVEISATFFSGSSSILREIGVDWSTLSSDGRVEVDHFGAAQVGQDVFNLNVDASDFTNGWDIQALFSAFEANNEGEIISSPTIRVMDGEEGRIQVGEDFSIRRQDFAGNVIDEFFSAGTILEVEPLIIEQEGFEPFIYMTLEAERSTATPDEISTVISIQEADTDILMNSGEATVIAGLYETEEQRVRRGIPLLKDLPGWFFGLRYIFGYNSTEVSTDELVIVIEAEIVPDLETRLQDLQTDPHEELERQLNRMRGIDTEIDTPPEGGEVPGQEVDPDSEDN